MGQTIIQPELPKIIVLFFILKWVANYGLKKLKMEISSLIGPKCTHQKSVQRLAAVKYCSIFPSVEVNVSWDFVVGVILSQLSPLLSQEWQCVLGRTSCEYTHSGFCSSCKTPPRKMGLLLGNRLCRILLDKREPLREPGAILR